MVSQSLDPGFHGCDRSRAEEVISGRREIPSSSNKWDWLGNGVYFWEDSQARALLWAKEQAARRGSRVKSPAVIGAVIDLGYCLNLIDADALQHVRAAHQAYLKICKEAEKLPVRNAGIDMKARHLDCAVMETLHGLRKSEGLRQFDQFEGSSLKADRFMKLSAFASSITFKSVSETQSRYWDTSGPGRRSKTEVPRKQWTGA